MSARVCLATRRADETEKWGKLVKFAGMKPAVTLKLYSRAPSSRRNAINALNTAPVFSGS
jgi:hypothetical protein